MSPAGDPGGFWNQLPRERITQSINHIGAPRLIVSRRIEEVFYWSE